MTVAPPQLAEEMYSVFASVRDKTLFIVNVLIDCAAMFCDDTKSLPPDVVPILIVTAPGHVVVPPVNVAPLTVNPVLLSVIVIALPSVPT